MKVIIRTKSDKLLEFDIGPNDARLALQNTDLTQPFVLVASTDGAINLIATGEILQMSLLP